MYSIFSGLYKKNECFFKLHFFTVVFHCNHQWHWNSWSQKKPNKCEFVCVFCLLVLFVLKIVAISIWRLLFFLVSSCYCRIPWTETLKIYYYEFFNNDTEAIIFISASYFVFHLINAVIWLLFFLLFSIYLTFKMIFKK